MGLWEERTSSTVERCVKRRDLFFPSLHIPFYSTLCLPQLWNTFHPPQLVRPALERTLEALKLDYVDLYIVELPMAFKVFMHSSWIGRCGWTQMSVINRFTFDFTSLSSFNIQHHSASLFCCASILAWKWLLPKGQRWKVYLPPHRPLCNMGGEFTNVSFHFSHLSEKKAQ